MKVCTICKQEKPESDYSFRNKKNGILSRECRLCHRILRRKYYLFNLKIEKQRVKKVKEKNKEAFQTLKASLKCNKCGENHPAVLQFHHLDPSKKELTISHAVARGIGSKKLEAEIAKCIVLCANCHFKLHWDERNAGIAQRLGHHPSKLA